MRVRFFAVPAVCLFFCASVFSQEETGSRTVRVAFGSAMTGPVHDTSVQESDRFFRELFEHIAVQEKWNPRYQKQSGPGLPPDDGGGADLILGMAYTDKTSGRFRFSKETILSTWGEVAASDRLKISTFMDLAGSTVGLVQGDLYNEAFRRIISSLNIECRFIEFSDYEQILAALKRGWVDAGVFDHLGARGTALPEGAAITPIIFSPVALRFAQPLEADPQLLEVVDYQLTQLKKTRGSAYYQLMEAFFDKERPAKISPLVFWLLGGAGLLACWLGAFSWILHRRVRGKTRELFDKNRDLENSRSRLQLALDVANDGLWDLDVRSGRLYMSPRWHTMLGYEQGDIEPDYHSMADIVHPDDRQAVEQGMQSLERTVYSVFDLDYRLRMKDGGWKWVASRAKAVERSPGGEPLRIVGTILDIDSRKATEFELAEAKFRAEAASVAKSSFLAHMSHELRTPLNAVIGLTSLLMRSEMDDEQHEQVKTVQASGEMLLTLINDILDISKVEAGELKLEHHIFNLRRCVESAVDLVASRADEKRLEFSYHVEPEVPVNIIGDIVRLRQILLNLLNNAVKFTERGEVALTIRSVPHPESGKCNIHFTVRDTGIGISSGQMQYIFQPFRQADSSTTRRYGGTGLGLTICDKLVRLMHGTVEVESVPGKGSSFGFNIEAGVAAAEAGEQDQSLKNNLPALLDKQVLVVDDNATNRCILEKYLRLWGANPVMASSGFEALAILENHPPFAFALLDMAMPGMDGMELARTIRDRPAFKKFPMIMLTSAMGHDDEFKSFDFAGVLFKPVKPAVLCKTVLRIFSRQPVREQAGKSASVSVDETRPLRILMAEDNPINQRVCALLLGKLGFTADVAANGEEALLAVERSSYDVILMDVQMPVMGGLEATQEICRRWPEKIRPYIIGVSAHAMPEERERALSYGMNDYLSKPFNIDELRYALLKVPSRLPDLETA
ncbi:MAG: response regulator [Kiritimatiellales bacterium]